MQTIESILLGSSRIPTCQSSQKNCLKDLCSAGDGVSNNKGDEAGQSSSQNVGEKKKNKDSH